MLTVAGRGVHNNMYYNILYIIRVVKMEFFPLFDPILRACSIRNYSSFNLSSVHRFYKLRNNFLLLHYHCM